MVWGDAKLSFLFPTKRKPFRARSARQTEIQYHSVAFYPEGLVQLVKQVAEGDKTSTQRIRKKVEGGGGVPESLGPEHSLPGLTANQPTGQQPTTPAINKQQVANNK